MNVKISSMKTNTKQLIFYILGGLVGTLGGFLYWKLVGCQGQSCPIWSSPWKSTLAGLLLGCLAGGSLYDLIIYLQKKNQSPNH
jgi:H+/Cl- antiporter ClcA